MNSEIKFAVGGDHGDPENSSLYHVCIDGKHRNIPNFIIYNEDKNLKCRIKLNKPEYLDDKEYNDRLSKEECIMLNKWMNEECKFYNRDQKSNWKSYLGSWFFNWAYNSAYKAKNPKQPDYTKLYKEE